MILNTLFEAIDQKPFRPFTIELLSGRRIQVAHPDNIFIMPSRQKVRNIEVYGPEDGPLAMFGPDGIVGIFFDGNGANGS